MKGSPQRRNKWPKPMDIWRYWNNSCQALEAHEREVDRRPGKTRSLGVTKAQREAEFRALREELDSEVVLFLVASFEALVRLDFLARAEQGMSDPVVRRFKEKFPRKDPSDPKIEMKSILQAWKPSHPDKDAVSCLQRLIEFRDWLAHGRWWVQERHFDPHSVTSIARKLAGRGGFPSIWS